LVPYLRHVGTDSKQYRALTTDKVRTEREITCNCVGCNVLEAVEKTVVAEKQCLVHTFISSGVYCVHSNKILPTK